MNRRNSGRVSCRCDDGGGGRDRLQTEVIDPSKPKPSIFWLRRFFCYTFSIASNAMQGSITHEHKILTSGELVEVIRHPITKKWKVRAYWWDIYEPPVISWCSVDAFFGLGWREKKFDSADDAFDFLEEQIRSGNVPGCPSNTSTIDTCREHVDFAAYEGKKLESGEYVTVVKDRVTLKWRILEYSWRLYMGPLTCWSHVDAFKGLGWGDREFDTDDEAIDFAEKQIESGKVPGCPARPTSEEFWDSSN